MPGPHPNHPPDPRQQPEERAEPGRLVERDGLLVFTGPLHPSPGVDAFTSIECNREERARVVSNEHHRRAP